VTVGQSGVITVTGSTKKLTIAAGKTLSNSGTVSLIDAGSLVLTSGATGSDDGAKMTGSGTVSAGETEIVGGAGGWEAKHAGSSGGTVIIKAGATGDSTTPTATITGGADVSLTAGAGATITQNAGTNNNLTIAVNTTIALGGSGGTELGKIVLKNDTSAEAETNNGKLTLTDGTSEITTGNIAGFATAVVLLDAWNGDSTAQDTAFTKLAIDNLKGDGTNAKAKTTASAPDSGTGAAGKLVSLEGDSAGTVTGGGATADAPDGVISAATDTKATGA
jgi:hypothetical protein